MCRQGLSIAPRPAPGYAAGCHEIRAIFPAHGDPGGFSGTGSAAARNSFNFAINLSTNFATPHVQWARPLPDGPVRALFVIHISGQPAANPRGIVELMQRFDLEAEVVYADARYGVVCGEDQGVERLSDLLEKEYDVFVFGNVGAEILPDEIQRRVLERVSAGTGLVSIGPGPSGPARHRLAPDEPVRANDPVEVLCGSGLAGLLDIDRRDAEPSRSVAGELLWAYTHGEGRQINIHCGETAGARRQSRGLTERPISQSNPLRAGPCASGSRRSGCARGGNWPATK